MLHAQRDTTPGGGPPRNVVARFGLNVSRRLVQEVNQKSIFQLELTRPSEPNYPNSREDYALCCAQYQAGANMSG